MPNPYAIDLVNYSENTTITGADFKQTLSTFVNSLKEARRGEADESITILAPGLASHNLSRASQLAKICNSMVRSECPWQPLIGPMNIGLQRCLKKAAPLLDCLKQNLKADPDDEEAFQKEIRIIKDNILPISGMEMPKAYGAWVALERFSHLALTVLSMDVKARAATKQALGDDIAEFAPWFPCLEELVGIFAILEDEPLLVIDVDGHKGFVGKFGGAVSNAQLLILIMDTLPNLEVFPKEFVCRELVESAKGIGPMNVGKKFDGLWNHYTYPALRSNGKLPDPKDLTANKHWVWMDNCPSGIPTIEGHRTILLGPPSYERSWSFARANELVSAKIDVETELTRGDIDYWMKKIMDANYG